MSGVLGNSKVMTVQLKLRLNSCWKWNYGPQTEGIFIPLHRRHPFEAERSDLMESMVEGRTGKRRSLEDALANTGKSEWEAFMNSIWLQSKDRPGMGASIKDVHKMF